MSRQIAPTAVVAAGAELGRDVVIGHGTIVHDRVAIGDGARIGEHCVIGLGVPDAGPLRIGAGSVIRSHSVLYEGSDLGERLETGHHVLIRAGVRAGANLRLGTQAALEGRLRIGDYVRIQGYSVLGPGSEVGDFAWIFPRCTLTNDPLPPSHVVEGVSIGDAAVVCTNVTVLPGVRVGLGAFVAAGAVAGEDVPAASILRGDGRYGGPVTGLMHLPSGTRHPWLRHYADAFPDDAQGRLAELFERVRAAARTAPREIPA